MPDLLQTVPLLLRPESCSVKFSGTADLQLHIFYFLLRFSCSSSHTVSKALSSDPDRFCDILAVSSSFFNFFKTRAFVSSSSFSAVPAFCTLQIPALSAAARMRMSHLFLPAKPGKLAKALGELLCRVLLLLAGGCLFLKCRMKQRQQYRSLFCGTICRHLLFFCHDFPENAPVRISSIP